MSATYQPWTDDKASSVVHLKPKVGKLGAELDELLGSAPTAQNKDSDANPRVPDLWAELDEMLAEQKQDGAKPIGASTPKKPGLVKLKDTVLPLNLSADLPKGHSFLIGAGGGGLLPMGSLTVMAAPGGMMKTTVAMAWSAHIASGQVWNGMPVRQGAVLFVSMEDDPDETMRKGIGITRAQIEPGLHSEVERCLYMAMCYGIDTRLTSSAFGANQRTGVVDQIIDFAKGLEVACGEPVTLIVFDHARLAIGGDVNDSGAVTELTRALNLIGKLTGAAILLLCHSPKSTVNPNHSGIHTAADVLGSGAFVDNARQAIVLSTLIDDERKQYGLNLDDAKKYVAMRVIKSNYSETDRAFYIRKTPIEGWGIVVPDVVTLTKPVRVPVAPVRNEDKVHAHIQNNPGRFTRTSLKLQAGTDGPLAMGEKAVMQALEGLMVSGRVTTRAPTPLEVETHNLSKQVKEILCADDELDPV